MSSTHESTLPQPTNDSMASPTTVQMEKLYSRKTEELALLAQKIQISKQYDLIAKHKAKAGDVDVKLKTLEADINTSSAELIPLERSYDAEYNDWKAKFTRLEALLSNTADQEDLATVIEDLKTEIQSESTRPAPLDSRLALLELRSALKIMEKEKAKVQEAKDMIDDLEDEAHFLKVTVEVTEKEIVRQWGEDSQEQEILRLKAELEVAIAAKNTVETTLEDSRYLMKAGEAIRHRKEEWDKAKSCQSERILDLGDRASHYGMALADAQLGMRRGFPDEHTAHFVKVYAFHPIVVLYLEDSVKFVAMIDWRGDMLNFRKEHSSSGIEFEHCFSRVMLGSYIATYMGKTIHPTWTPRFSKATAQDFSVYCEADESASIHHKTMERIHKLAMAKHKMAIRSR